jgi:hypothetical protein
MVDYYNTSKQEQDKDKTRPRQEQDKEKARTKQEPRRTVFYCLRHIQDNTRKGHYKCRTRIKHGQDEEKKRTINKDKLKSK